MTTSRRAWAGAFFGLLGCVGCTRSASSEPGDHAGVEQKATERGGPELEPADGEDLAGLQEQDEEHDELPGGERKMNEEPTAPAAEEDTDPSASEPIVGASSGLCGLGADDTLAWAFNTEGLSRIAARGQRELVYAFSPPDAAQLQPRWLSVKGRFTLASVDFMCGVQGCGGELVLLHDGEVRYQQLTQSPAQSPYGELDRDGHVLVRSLEGVRWVSPDGSFERLPPEIYPISHPDARGVLAAVDEGDPSGERHYGFYSLADHSFVRAQGEPAQEELGGMPLPLGSSLTFSMWQGDERVIVLESDQMQQLAPRPLGSDYARYQWSEQRMMWFGGFGHSALLLDGTSFEIHELMLGPALGADAELQVSGSAGGFLLYEVEPSGVQRLRYRIAPGSNELEVLDAIATVQGNAAYSYCAPQPQLYPDGAIAAIDWSSGLAQAVGLEPDAQRWSAIGAPMHDVQQIWIGRQARTWGVQALGPEPATYCAQNEWAPLPSESAALSGHSTQLVRDGRVLLTDRSAAYPLASPKQSDNGACVLLTAGDALHMHDLERGDDVVIGDTSDWIELAPLGVSAAP